MSKYATFTGLHAAPEAPEQPPCPECEGKCCRDDLGYRRDHLDWDVGGHHCDHCTDGTKYVAPNGLYLLTQTKERGYDTYDACVVVATSKTSAKFTHPRHDYAWDGRRWLRGDIVPTFSNAGGWCHPDHVEVTYLGVADSNLKLGVVCASFNAG